MPIASGDVEVELNVIETLYGIFPFGQVMAPLASLAFAPAGDHSLSRSTLDTIRHQPPMVRGDFDPSAAVINKAIKAVGKSKSSLDWDKTTRATYGLFSLVPMSTN